MSCSKRMKSATFAQRASERHSCYQMAKIPSVDMFAFFFFAVMGKAKLTILQDCCRRGVKTKSNEILFLSKDCCVTEGRETFMPAAHKRNHEIF